jgi:hypothetical protein
MDTFGLIPSDVQCLDDGKPAPVFMRCDRGDDPADHHTVVVTQNVTDTYSHSAFEVIDFDYVAMGQQYLQSKGWRHAWGVGRHILGSQIFDYWRDLMAIRLSIRRRCVHRRCRDWLQRSGCCWPLSVGPAGAERLREAENDPGADTESHR